MLSEAAKRKLLSSREYFSVKRWEGKPFSVKFKFAVANYPEMVLATFLICGVSPIICAYNYFSYKNSRREAMTKYFPFYKVVRDDDPNLQEYLRLKELGREFFPKA